MPETIQILNDAISDKGWKVIYPVVIVCPDCGQHSPPIDPTLKSGDTQTAGRWMGINDSVDSYIKSHEELHEKQALEAWGKNHGHRLNRVAASSDPDNYGTDCSCGAQLGPGFAGEGRIAEHLAYAKAHDEKEGANG